MTSSKRWVHRLSLLLLPLVLASPARAEAREDAATALQHLLEDRALRGARVGVAVEDLTTGDRVVSWKPDRLMVPASNQKLIVTAAALSRWGPTHRFETPVFVDGAVSASGVLDGRLWIQGRGDPSLVSETLWKLAEEIRLHGISEVRGGIGVDVSFFDGSRIHPDWEPISSRAYHAPTSAFAANYSSFRIEVTGASEAGAPALVRVAPGIPYFRVRSEALTASRPSSLQVTVEPLPSGDGERIRVRGVFPLGAEPKTYWRSVSLPEHYAVALLRAQLEAQGIRVSGSSRLGRVPSEARELLRFRGDRLDALISRLNKYSNNFIAEQLTKLLGAETSGPPATWEKGVRALESYLRSIGVTDRQVVVADGSGLSARNRVSPAVLTRVIREAAQRVESGPEFLASLPLGGRDGTLEDRMEGLDATVRGKTGHLRHVSSLSGVVPAADGPSLAFSVLVNGARGSYLDVDAAVDAFVAALSPGGYRRGELPCGGDAGADCISTGDQRSDRD